MKNLVLVTLLTSLLTSCFASNPYENTPGNNGKIANGWNGLWDGTIAPISFVVSLFNKDVEVYNPNSNGWYTFGFMVGIGAFSRGCSTTRKKKD